MDREANDTNLDYMYVNVHENKGLRFYLHKYFTGMHNYYMQSKNEEFYKSYEELHEKPDLTPQELVKA